MVGTKWVIEIKEKLGKMAESNDVVSEEAEQWKKHSIYKIPACFTDHNTNAYRPRAVSFGPYYHGEDQFKPMEYHKNRALLHFLRRSNKPVELFIDSVTQVAQHLKDSYDPLDLCWQEDTERFVQMMITDGCFMLEILLYYAGELGDYAANDPIFSGKGKFNIMPHIVFDMLVLENQLPMLLLGKLLAVHFGEEKREDFVNHCIFKFCSPAYNYSQSAPRLGKCVHVLDVYRKALLVQEPRSKTNKVRIRAKRNSDVTILWSATQLSERGISFRRSETNCLTDVSFHGNILRLPVIVVDDTTESIFLNMIVFERLHADAGSEVTSFIFFMDSLIRCERDVEFLESKGILLNVSGRAEDVVELFNSLCKYMTVDADNWFSFVQVNMTLSLDSVRTKLSAFGKSAWNDFRAKVVGKYFRSPWAIFTLTGAIFFAALTIAQTLYTILPYYHKNQKGKM